jgi:hypothetical protein
VGTCNFWHIDEAQNVKNMGKTLKVIHDSMFMENLADKYLYKDILALENLRKCPPPGEVSESKLNFSIIISVD